MGTKLGYNLTTDKCNKVGKIVAKLYREANGTAQSKHTQLVNGQAMEVNTYFAQDAELVKKALEQYAQHMNQQWKMSRRTSAASRRRVASTTSRYRKSPSSPRPPSTLSPRPAFARSLAVRSRSRGCSYSLSSMLLL